MYNKKTFLAIITARGGSKRLPNKNILSLNGKPLIAWTIDSAIKSKYIDETIVSTDNRNIAKIAKKYGANIPFIRPAKLATDQSTSVAVVLHAINYYSQKLSKVFDYIVLLQPTSPLRDNFDIDKAIELISIKKADALISASEEAKKSPGYNPNGAIYIIRRDIFQKEKTFYIKKNLFVFLMPSEKSIDINTKIDFDLAERLMKKTKND